MKISLKKFALQLPKQDLYSFKLCTVDKVHENICCYLVNKQKLFCTAVIRIGIVLIKTHFVALRTFDPRPRRRQRVSEVGL